jgi:hypothetical protein
MARREFQIPCVLRQEGPRPYWYIRYRRKVLVGKNEIERREVRHTLGDCSRITKRRAQHLRDEVLREVNREVYTVQSQILFQDFAELYMKQHTVTCFPLSCATFGTEEVQTFLNAKHTEGLAWRTRKGCRQ